MIAQVISQMPAEAAAAIISYGPLGAILLWFMWFVDKLRNEIAVFLTASTA
jgi:hypothetical protein